MRTLLILLFVVAARADTPPNYDLSPTGPTTVTLTIGGEPVYASLADKSIASGKVGKWTTGDDGKITISIEFTALKEGSSIVAVFTQAKPYWFKVTVPPMPTTAPPVPPKEFPLVEPEPGVPLAPKPAAKPPTIPPAKPLAKRLTTPNPTVRPLLPASRTTAGANSATSAASATGKATTAPRADGSKPFGIATLATASIPTSAPATVPNGGTVPAEGSTCTT